MSRETFHPRCAKRAGYQSRMRRGDWRKRGGGLVRAQSPLAAQTAQPPRSAAVSQFLLTRRTPFALAALVVGLLACGGYAQAADLRLSFEDVKTVKGTVLVAVYDSEATYDAGKPVASEMIPVTGAIATTTIKGLKPGRYAFKAFHDLDGDFKMATNPFGMPTEPYAFSNGAKPDGGPPPWSKAAFDVAEPGAVQTVHID